MFSARKICMWLLCLAPQFVLAADELEAVKLRLKWTHQFQFAGYYAAKHKGYYEAAGFDVDIQSRGPGGPALDALEQGAVEFAATDTTAILHHLWGRPVVMVTPIFQSNPLVLITLKSSGLTTPEDLRGKRIMYRRHQGGGNIEAMLIRSGLDATDYREISHSYDVNSLLRGEVDAMSVYITDQPFKLAEQGVEFSAINPADYGVSLYGDLLATSARYASQNPDGAKAFADATLQGWQYAKQNPQEIIALIREHYAPELSAQKLEFEAEQTLKILEPLGAVDYDRLRYTQETFKTLGYLHTDDGLSDLLLKDFVNRPWYRRISEAQLAGLLAGSSVAIAIIFLLGIFTRRLQVRVDEKTSEIVKANMELTSTVKALEVANSLADEANRSKNLFLANMSHEIRTPMNGIYGSLQILKNQVSNDESGRLINGALQSARHLLQILNDVLDVSKIEAGKLTIEPVGFNLNELIDETLLTYRNLADAKALDLTCDFEVLNPMIYTDPVRVKQIVGNLVSNAIKFTHQGSVGLKVTSDNEQLTIVVADTGIGLDAKSQSKIFSRFEQADGSTTRKYGGTGLGLSISSTLAEMLDGRLDLDSEVGLGSTFTLKIPISIAQDEVIFGDDNHQADFSKLEILVAEDNQLNQEIVAMMLEESGIHCRLVDNGEQAVHAVREQQPDLVLMDVQMPIMDGLQATEIILDEFPEIPVVALTANVMKDDIEKYQASGFVGHVGKPFEESDLLNMIAEISNRRSASP